MSKRLRLKADNVSCERGGRMVIENLSFEIENGCLVALRGPNGAGKSTLLRLLAGLNVPSGGKLTLEGGAPDASIPEQCHYVGHSDALKPALTVRENLDFWTDFLGEEKSNSALEGFGLRDLADDQVMFLSAGQKRRLALSRLIPIARPIWLLDEPTVGLDSKSLDRLSSHMHVHLATGGIVIAATHADLGIAVSQTITLGVA
ncbi:MAG: heme ABC exporter ATP-binding protein CcmA [Alphaproteobacteria bacterium]|nr:heme ABC exporter ATP-binding protein CcmA [Alphaproteobacteria bacterium]